MNLFKYLKQTFHFPGFQSFLYSGFLTSIANWNYVVAMTALIYQQFGTTGVAIFGLTRQIPYILFSPISGYIIDRFPRKKIIIFINLLNVLSMTMLIIFSFLKINSLYVFLLVSLIQVFVGTIDYPIRLTIGKKLVDKDSLLAMNTLTTSLGTISLMIAPIIGGVLVGLNDLFWAFLINVLVYLICLVLVCFIPKSINQNFDGLLQTEQKIKISDSLNNIVEGFKFILFNKKIFSVSIILCFIHIVVGSVFVFVPYLADITGQEGSGTGYYLAINGLGCVIGTLLGGHFGKKNLTFIIWISVLGSFIACIICGGINHVFVAYLAVLFIGIFTMLPEAPIMTIIQEETPDNASGRVFAAIDVLIIGGMGIGSFLVGWLFANTTFMFTLFVIGILPVIVSLLMNKFLYVKNDQVNNSSITEA